MKLRCLIFLSFSILFSITVFGQQDNEPFKQYLVHNVGDTLFGSISLDKKYIKIDYINYKNEQVLRNFLYKDIQEYKGDSGHFIKKKISFFPKGKFLKVIHYGKIIYYYDKIEGWVNGAPGFNGVPPAGPYYHSKELYYVQKGEKFFRLKQDVFKRQLKKIFADDTDSLKRIKNRNFNWSHIPVLIKDYNERHKL